MRPNTIDIFNCFVVPASFNFIFMFFFLSISINISLSFINNIIIQPPKMVTSRIQFSSIVSTAPKLFSIKSSSQHRPNSCGALPSIRHSGIERKRSKRRWRRCRSMKKERRSMKKEKRKQRFRDSVLVIKLCLGPEVLSRGSLAYLNRFAIFQLLLPLFVVLSSSFSCCSFFFFLTSFLLSKMIPSSFSRPSTQSYAT